MEYLKCFWYHSHPNKDAAVILFYEVDETEERYARRLVEVFSDRHIKQVDNEGFEFVTEAPVPTAEEINNMSLQNEPDQFYALNITKEEFEQIWAMDGQRYTGNLVYYQ